MSRDKNGFTFAALTQVARSTFPSQSNSSFSSVQYKWSLKITLDQDEKPHHSCPGQVFGKQGKSCIPKPQFMSVKQIRAALQLMRATGGDSLTSQVAAIITCLFSIWLPNVKHLTDTKKDLSYPSFPVIKRAAHYSVTPAHRRSQTLLAQTFTMTTALQQPHHHGCRC